MLEKDCQMQAKKQLLLVELPEHYTYTRLQRLTEQL